ncbi:MAG: 50S ribosomal protein L6 [Candidatus Pacearchaeota archaeon]
MEKEKITRRIDIPEGYFFIIEEDVFVLKKDGKELRKRIKIPRNISLRKENNSIFIEPSKKSTKKESKIIGTIEAHIKNMIRGLDKPFVYKMEACYAHFPMTLKVEGDKLVIRNFLGEKVPRYADILPGVKVEIKGNILEVSSEDIDSVGQTVANIERATKIKERDRRVFQDGIFLVEKDGREI